MINLLLEVRIPQSHEHLLAHRRFTGPFLQTVHLAVHATGLSLPTDLLGLRR